jgi:hypothetical protein
MRRQRRYCMACVPPASQSKGAGAAPGDRRRFRGVLLGVTANLRDSKADISSLMRRLSVLLFAGALLLELAGLPAAARRHVAPPDHRHQRDVRAREPGARQGHRTHHAKDVVDEHAAGNGVGPRALSGQPVFPQRVPCPRPGSSPPGGRPRGIGCRRSGSRLPTMDGGSPSVIRHSNSGIRPTARSFNYGRAARRSRLAGAIMCLARSDSRR